MIKEKSLSILLIKTLRNIFKFSFRKYSQGDNGVIQQIFKNRDYDFSMWQQGKQFQEYYEKISESSTPLIVDAGANIGASAVYFFITFPKSFIFSIEPNKDNYDLLNKNTECILSKYNLLGAISNSDGEVFILNPEASDWSFRTKKISSDIDKKIQTIPAICPNSILDNEKTRGMVPLILKIDIEGGESELFQGNTEWLEKFPLVIIELHDWMLPFSGSSRNFIKAVAAHDFDFLYRGENIFLFNRKIFSSIVQ